MRYPSIALVAAALAASSFGTVRAEDIALATVGNVRFIASVTEPSPKQYQVYVRGEQTSPRASCHLFTATIKSITGRAQQNSALAGTQSFLLDPEDFPVRLLLTQVRVAYWDDWQRKNSSGYGNPCLSAPSGQQIAASLNIPANPNLPCDSIQVAPAGLRVTQHLAISDREVRVELTEQNSVRTDTAQLASIDMGNLKIQNLDGMMNIRAPAQGRSVAVDRLGKRADDELEQLEIVCPTQADASRIVDLLRRRQR